MEPFAGFEPHIGEIRAVRTFRIGPAGVLYPLFSESGWSSGVNTARCRVALGPNGLGELDDHVVPDPSCTCGFYAYASEAAASEYPNTRHVLAVVSCWGGVIAGTRGVRTQYARIDAIWMSATVPSELAAAVAHRYDDASIYSDKQQMLSEHPLTTLDCYEPDVPDSYLRKRGRQIGVAAALLLGLCPHSWLTSHRDLLLTWWLELALVLATMAISFRRSGNAAKRRVVQTGALALWLLAPFGGAAGTFLLRLPMIKLVVLIAAQRHALAREANRFPARIPRVDH